MRTFPKLGLQITSVFLSVLLFSTSIFAQSQGGWGGSSGSSSMQGTQSRSSDAATAMVDAQMDASSNSQFIWFLPGLCCFYPGIIGFLFAVLLEPDPPVTRFVGKSAEYIIIYTSEYKRLVKKSRVKASCAGLIVGLMGLVVFEIAVLSSISPGP